MLGGDKMQTIYLLIGKEKLYLYEKNANLFERLYIEGNPDYSYDINNVKYGIQQLMDNLVNEYNLDTKAEIDFIVIDNENEIISEVVEKIIGEYESKKYTIDSIIIKVFNKLSRDKKLLIEEYGINFDGKNYLLINGNLNKKEFSLLGYTLQEDNLMKYVD